MNVETVDTTPVHQRPPASLGDPEPNLAIAGVTKAVCRPCAKTFTWTDTPIASCPDCNGPLTITAATGETAAEAIARAAEQLPDRVERQAPRQPSIPGLKPPFDYASAMESITGARHELRVAEAIADSKHKDAGRAKKTVDELQSTLNQLIDDFEDRIIELEAEASLSPADRRARGCSWEARTGSPCAICREDGATTAFNGNPSHLASALIVAAQHEQATPPQIRTVLAAILEVLVPEDTIALWTSEDIVALAYWLERVANDHALKADTTSSDRPEILGRAHVIAEAGSCRLCGTLLHPLAASFELDAFAVGTLVGVDCPGEIATEPALRPRKRHATKEARQKAKQTITREARTSKGRVKAGMTRGRTRGRR